ncbi:MAG: UDP-2,3-diacylglucosamine diphosphatase [Planctomycetota bacterium]
MESSQAPSDLPLAPYKAGEATVPLDGKRTAVFTDLHLDPERYQEIHAFAVSLLPLAGICNNLVILGDLFESYIGRESYLHPAFEPLQQAFAHLNAHQCRIIVLRGNRDVLLSPADGKALGFEVADSVSVMGVDGKVLLTHGDAFCLADLPYQKLRRILRFPGLRPLLRTLPAWVRFRLALRLRNHSKAEVARKPLNSMHLTLAKVDEVMAEEGAKVAWIGHLHAAATHDLSDDRQLRVLPAWEPGTAAAWIQESLDETA